jgi:hypothetical protein
LIRTNDVLFVISLADRVVQIAGIKTRPDESWMLQVGRNLIAEDDGALASTRYLTIDQRIRGAFSRVMLIREQPTTRNDTRVYRRQLLDGMLPVITVRPLEFADREFGQYRAVLFSFNCRPRKLNRA